MDRNNINTLYVAIGAAVVALAVLPKGKAITRSQKKTARSSFTQKDREQGRNWVTLRGGAGIFI